MHDQDIPAKANRVLNVILLALLLILIRVWFLAVVHREDYVQLARKPQTRTVVERVERATIRDRFNLPLALNKVQYNAAVCYAQLRTIPTSVWKVDASGRKTRVAARSAYIADLARVLAQELDLEERAIEDLIHGKAALFPHTPFVLKHDISEEQYYRLKMLEKDWAGVQAERTSKRFYPQGRVASDVIGFMGAISHKEYAAVEQEMEELRAYLRGREEGEMPFLPKGFSSPFEVRARLSELEEKAYTIHDLVGKSGIEGAYDAVLRGYSGRRCEEIDTKGNVLRDLPGARRAVSGQRVVLTLSSELQEYAESLLARYEADNPQSLSSPWIKGGAIVAMIPQTGEVVALASYPRFDPNDFIPHEGKRGPAVLRWLEVEPYVGAIWDGKRLLERECFREGFYEESLRLTWERYLEAILAPDSSTKRAMAAVRTIRDAVGAQRGGSEDSLVIDLCRLAADADSFSEPLLEAVGSHSLSLYRDLCQEMALLQGAVKERARQLFHVTGFLEWRLQNFPHFLQQKREEEKREGRYARPYTEYLEGAERALFQQFWNENRWDLVEGVVLGSRSKSELASYLALCADNTFPVFAKLHEVVSALPPDLARVYLRSMRSFEDLTRPLQGRYRRLRQQGGAQLEKHLAAAFYPPSGYGYGRSQAYRQSTPQGSLFKLVTAYAALIDRLGRLQDKHASIETLNPLSIVDDKKWAARDGSGQQILGHFLDGSPIRRMYKGGRLPRSSHAGIGRVDLLGALEQSSNIYFSLLASDCLQDPAFLIEAAHQFGFGEKTGIELSGEISGNVPEDVSYNRTGLYSFAIGQHSLVVTPLQTAAFLSALAHEGALLRPTLIRMVAGQEPDREGHGLSPTPCFPFKEALSLAGAHFPLFSETQRNSRRPSVSPSPVEVRQQVFLPPAVRSLLLEGMRRVVSGSRGTARPPLIRALADDPRTYREYLDVQNRIVGKTGTAEILYKQTLDGDTAPQLENHVWFGAISFSSPHQVQEKATLWGEPELVVVVYLRFGGAGKAAAPLAAKIIRKWREVQAAHASPGSN
jgi:cell division protein FtsI/penicillin-binding protein 2